MNCVDLSAGGPKKKTGLWLWTLWNLLFDGRRQETKMNFRKSEITNFLTQCDCLFPFSFPLFSLHLLDSGSRGVVGQ